jgi:hypothetical protein
VVFDFEDDEGWTVVRGDVWAGPSFRRASVHRHRGGFIGTAETEDGERKIEQRGVLRSPDFVVDHDYLVLRAGISGDKGCIVAVRNLDGEDVHKIAPKEGRMLTFIWDAREYEGESLALFLVDRPKPEVECSVHIDYVRLVDG